MSYTCGHPCNPAGLSAQQPNQEKVLLGVSTDRQTDRQLRGKLPHFSKGKPHVAGGLPCCKGPGRAASEVQWCSLLVSQRLLWSLSSPQAMEGALTNKQWVESGDAKVEAGSPRRGGRDPPAPQQGFPC